MKSSVLHQLATTEVLSTNFCYELDAGRYPSLGNEFFIRLREKYPRAFQRTVPRDVGRSSTSSSGDSKSIWSLWDCNGDDGKAVFKEAGGILIPCSDLSVDERLKRNCDSFSSAKTTGDDLIITLRSFRNALIADSKPFYSQHPIEDVVGGCTSDGSGHRGAASNPSTSSSVSRNSSSEAKSLLSLSKNDSVLCRETVGMPSILTAACELQPGTSDSASGTDATFNYSHTEPDTLHVQLEGVVASNPAVDSSLLQTEDKNQVLGADKLRSVSHATALPLEHSQTETNQGCEDNERATTVDFDAKLQEKSAGSESGFKVDIDELHGSADEPQLDVVSASTYQLRTSQKPPLMKKAKSHQQNVRPALGESARNYTSSSSFFMSNDNVPEVPRSAEMVRRKLRLPWKKKKQYLPGEEVSRWRSNFESWRSASQLSLESDTATERGLWRSESQSELENADSVSVGWTDSDTDAMSDDPLGESFNERARRIMAMSSQSIDSSADTHHSSSWRSSLRSSARKRLSSLQRAAGQRLLRLQKALSVGHNFTDNDFVSETTAQVSELSGKRVRQTSESSNVSSQHSDIDSPRHFRPIGRVLSHNVADGTTTVELMRPPHGPYGIYLARDGNDLNNAMYISRLSDCLPVHFYAGLLHVGDEVLQINNVTVSGLSLDTVFDMIAQSSTLSLQLRRSTPPAAI